MTGTGQPTFAGVRRFSALDYIYRLPLMPWLCPPLHPELERVILNIGRSAVLQPHERLYGTGEPVSRIAVVRKGLVARKLGDFGTKSDNHIALAGPGNLATGNLNIFSHRPAVGRYEALVPTEIVWCGPKDFLAVVERDPALFRLLVLQCALSALSDRLAFACTLLQKSDAALKIFLLAWSFHFGHIEGDRVVSPRILTRESVKDVVGCSLGWLDRILKEWREEGILRGDRFIVAYPIDFLAEADGYLGAMEEQSGSVIRSRDVRTYWQSF